MKKTLTLIATAILSIATASADEGMWLPSLVGERIKDMQSKGFRLNAEDIYSINQASLKDAVVLFGRGCTGELISAEGLLITNHHCGYGQIQKHSSVEHDYLRDGFWAMTRDEELPNPGLTVSFLERMEDVTDQVFSALKPEMSEEERQAAVKEVGNKLIEAATSEGKGLRATMEALYYGNQYFLFVYREFSDVRLVGAPPSSIGKFGGDTDNWMWPRHTGDFSMFRIYADKDNNPAAYSKDNVPYHPKKYFKIDITGVKEGDFTFIYGFPGRTNEYIHSEGVRYISEIGDPNMIEIRTKRLEIQKKHMSQDQAVRIQYSSKNASVANAWKKWQGEVKGINKMKTVAVKQDYEKRFEEWAKGSEYEGITHKISKVYEELEPYQFARDYYVETARTIEIMNVAMAVGNLYKDGELDKERLESIAESFYKDYYLPIDKESFIAVMNLFAENVPEDFQPRYFKSQINICASVEEWADDIFDSSIFSDKEKVLALTSEDYTKVVSDKAFLAGKEFLQWYETKIQPERDRLQSELSLLYREYMRGQMEWGVAAKGGEGADPNAFYPDANLTLRVAYGNVKGYSPADAIYYEHSSTLKGIIEKDNPDIFDYNIPQTLRDIYAKRDFGRWVNEDGEVPVCFIATNHTTGGNSGSPVIDANGNLIGINFDRVWEGTMSDIVFDPEVCRNISLDMRYVMFIIDKVANADHLLDEMTFVKKSRNGKKVMEVKL